jgi:hypothetical protein
MTEENDIGFKIFASIDGLREQMAQASSSIKTFAEEGKEKLESLGTGFKSLAGLTEAFLAVLAVEKVEAFFDNLAQQAVQINRLGIEFGLTSTQVQELQFAMNSTGGSGDQLQSLFSRLSVAMQAAINNTGPQREAFDKMGISLKFLKENANNAPEVLYALADRVKALGAGSQVTAELIPLMGRGAASIVPLLAKGKEGIKELGDEAATTGGIMSQLEQEQFERMHSSLERMDTGFKGLKITIGSAFQPAMTGLVNVLADVISGLTGGTDHVSAFRVALGVVVLPIDAVVLALVTFKAGIVQVWEALEGLLEVVYYAFKAISVVIIDFVNGDFSKMGTDWDNVMNQMEVVTKKHMENIKKEWVDVKSTAQDMAQGYMNLTTGAGAGKKEEKKKEAGGGGKPQKTAEEIAKEAAAAKAAHQEEMQLAQLDVTTKQQLGRIELENKKQQLAAEVEAGKISKQEEIESLKRLAEEAYQIDLQALQKEATIEGLTKVQKQKLYDQELILKAKHEQDMQRLTIQSAQAQAADYHKLFDAFNSGFKSMITGILQGTQTWQQAMQNMFVNILSSFAGFLEEKAAKWAENQIWELLFGSATATAEAATGIGASAAQAGAAAYASTAAIPIIGPAMAPDAAAMAYGGAAAYMGAIPAAAKGFDIPAGVNPLTQLHEKEMVLPAELSERVRNMTGSGGGGGDTHLHVHAIDASSVKKFFMDNGDHVAAAVQKQIRNANPHLAKMKG